MLGRGHRQGRLLQGHRVANSYQRRLSQVRIWGCPVQKETWDDSPFPTTAIRVSMASSTVAGIRRTSTFPVELVSLLVVVVVLAASTSPPTLCVSRSWHLAGTPSAAFSSRAYAAFHWSSVKCMLSPLFSYPRSKTSSPMPSSIRSTRMSCSCLSDSSSSASSSDLRSILGAMSSRSRLSNSSSSSS